MRTRASGYPSWPGVNDSNQGRIHWRRPTVIAHFSLATLRRTIHLRFTRPLMQTTRRACIRQRYSSCFALFTACVEKRRFFREIAATSSRFFLVSTDCYLGCGSPLELRMSLEGTTDVLQNEGGQIGASLQICRYFRIRIAYDRRPTRQACNSLKQSGNFHRDQ
jgi:hypothetical protein